MALDKTGLDSRVFAAFAETSSRRYIYLCNMQTNVSRWSRSAVEYFDLPGEYMEDAGAIWEEYVHPEDRDMYREDIEAVFSGKKEYHDLTYRAKNKEGDYVVCTCRGYVLKGENDEHSLFAGTMTNRGLADNTDTVTGLPNIYEFMNRVRWMCREGEKGVILTIGLCRFSEINSIFGYTVGNRVLQMFGMNLKRMLGNKGTVYRMDGSKYAIILRDAEAKDASEVYQQICEMSGEGLQIEGKHIFTEIAAGAVCTNGGKNGTYSLRTSALYALEKSKREQHGSLVFFDDRIHQGDIRALELMDTLRQDIRNGCKGFYMCYQPFVNAKDGRIQGAEALLRWNMEPYGEVSPAIFIPVLENDPRFYELGKWILRRSLEETLEIVKKDPDFIVNVNVSYSQMERSEFRNAVLEILKSTGFPPRNLCLELTERCQNIDKEYLRRELTFFRSVGIRIAMDDFGTGFASFNLLREIPIDCLKVDRAFISGIETNGTDQVIVDSMVHCAKGLGMKICLEGIENRNLKEFVGQYEADWHQGYHYSVPVPMEKFKELLSDN